MAITKKHAPVSVTSCKDYSEPGLSVALEKCLENLGGMKAFVRRGDRVLLKPNLLMAKPPETGVCTQPEVAREVALLVRGAGGEPFFGDSPGGRPRQGGYQKAMDRSGLSEVAGELEIEVVRFDDEPVTISHPDGVVFKRFEVARAVTEADVVVTLPRLKTHNLTGLTAGVKINFGCIPGLRKIGYHVSAGREGVPRFAQMLVDLTVAIKPSLTILDAVVAMEGDGPTSGGLRNLGVLMASADPFAIDWAASELVGVAPLDVPTVAAAAESGLGPTSPGEVKIIGEPLESLRASDFVMPTTWDPSDRFGRLLSTAARTFAPRPKIRRDACENCNDCVDGCPTEALIKDKPTPKFVQKKCIRCYCCAEFCPNDAVEIVHAIIG